MSLAQLVLAEKLRRFIETESPAEFKEVVAPFVDFAALKTPIKAKAKKEKVCKGKSSFPCGYSCQPRYTRSGKETQCKSALNGQAKTYAEWLEKQVKSAKTGGQAKPKTIKEDPPKQATPKLDRSITTKDEPKSLQEFIDRGRAYGKAELNEIDKIYAKAEKSAKLKRLRSSVNEEYSKVLDEFKKDPVFEKAYEDDRLLDDPRLQAWKMAKYKLGLAEREIDDQAEVIMDRLRRKAILEDGLTTEQAREIVSTKQIDSAISPGDRTKVESAFVSAFRITNGRGSSTLDIIERSGSRAHASEGRRSINIGADVDQTTILHELAHHIEFESPVVKKVANDFIQKRATSATPEPLNKLTGRKQYRDDELAYPGDFIDPYVGKVYESKTTEVVSMGIQHFAYGHDMLKLYKRDKEHFEFMLGILRG